MKLYVYADGEVYDDEPVQWKSDDYLVIDYDIGSDYDWVFDIYNYFGVTKQSDEIISCVCDATGDPLH